jgi:hypothetical protein
MQIVRAGAPKLSRSMRKSDLTTKNLSNTAFPTFVYFVRFVVNNSPSFLADSRQQPVSGNPWIPFYSIQATTSYHLSRGNGSLTERGFSNPQEYADKNVRAPLHSELRAPFDFAQGMLRVRQRTDQPRADPSW